MVLFLTFNQTFFLVNVINYTMQEVFFILRHHTSYNPSLYACPVGKRASSCLGSFNSNFKIVPICFSGHFCKEKCHLFKYQNYLLHLCIFKDREKWKKISCHKQCKIASCPLPLFHFFHLLVPPLPPNVARACLQARKSSTRVCVSECNLVLLKVATSIYINC